MFLILQTFYLLKIFGNLPFISRDLQPYPTLRFLRPWKSPNWIRPSDRLEWSVILWARPTIQCCVLSAAKRSASAAQQVRNVTSVIPLWKAILLMLVLDRLIHYQYEEPGSRSWNFYAATNMICSPSKVQKLTSPSNLIVVFIKEPRSEQTGCETFTLPYQKLNPNLLFRKYFCFECGIRCEGIGNISSIFNELRLLIRMGPACFGSIKVQVVCATVNRKLRISTYAAVKWVEDAKKLPTQLAVNVCHIGCRM